MGEGGYSVCHLVNSAQTEINAQSDLSSVWMRK